VTPLEKPRHAAAFLYEKESFKAGSFWVMQLTISRIWPNILQTHCNTDWEWITEG